MSHKSAKATFYSAEPVLTRHAMSKGNYVNHTLRKTLAMRIISSKTRTITLRTTQHSTEKFKKHKYCKQKLNVSLKKRWQLLTYNTQDHEILGGGEKGWYIYICNWYGITSVAYAGRCREIDKHSPKNGKHVVTKSNRSQQWHRESHKSTSVLKWRGTRKKSKHKITSGN